MRWMPAPVGARRIAGLLSSRFGKIAIAGHAAAARDEMRGFAEDFLELAGEQAGDDLRQILAMI